MFGSVSQAPGQAFGMPVAVRGGFVMPSATSGVLLCPTVTSSMACFWGVRDVSLTEAVGYSTTEWAVFNA